jgi:histidinol phosphatase-like PHP family hydrolase
MREATFGALKNPFVDILAHPFQFGIKEQYISFFSTEYCNNLRYHAIQHSKYIEYNYSKYNGCVQQDYWKFPNFKVWIGSDSHSISDLKKNRILIEKIGL